MTKGGDKPPNHNQTGLLDQELKNDELKLFGESSSGKRLALGKLEEDDGEATLASPVADPPLVRLGFFESKEPCRAHGGRARGA